MLSNAIAKPPVLAPQRREHGQPAAAAATPLVGVGVLFERSSYQQPAACRAFGLTGTLGLFAVVALLALWASQTTVRRVAAPAPMAVTLDMAPIAAAPPAPPVDVPPGPVQHEQEGSSAAATTTDTSLPQMPLPTIPSLQPRAAPGDREADRASADLRRIEQTTAPPALPNPQTAAAARAASASAEQAGLANWRSQLLGHLKPYLRYPRQAQNGRQEGVALVSAIVDRKGNVIGARIDRGSGYPTLDSEAVATVRRGSPVPPPTADIRGDPVTVTIPIQFSLRR